MMKRLRPIVFPAWCALVFAGYALAALRGWGSQPAKDGVNLPPSLRQSPDGYRSSTFWRGGK